MGRFINSDLLVSTGQGLLGNNMFAYCRNNPVCRRDVSGATDEKCYDDGTNLLHEEKSYEGGKISTGDSGGSGGNSGPQAPSGGSGSTGYSYSAPAGGGGTTSSIQVGNKTVTFGHGGRHVGFSDISGLESAIANDVVTRPPTTGTSLCVPITYGGADFTYRYFTLSSTHINVGTYYYAVMK